MKKTVLKQISLWMFMFTFFVTALYILNLNWYSFSSVSANPDYICSKTLYNQPCLINSCWAWQVWWHRVCNWTKTTQVSYYHVRTSCEPWYYVTAVGWWSGAASWRQTWDWATWVSCSITEWDTVAPSWVIK